VPRSRPKRIRRPGQVSQRVGAKRRPMTGSANAEPGPRRRGPGFERRCSTAFAQQPKPVVMGPGLRRDDKERGALKAHLRDLAARILLREVSISSALQTKGAGNAGRPMRPIATCAGVVVESTRVSRSHRNHPALPTQWFTDYTCAPRCSGFLATVTGGIASANLTPASRCQDYTTSPSARKRPRQKRHSRPPHPAPRFATIMIRPFEWDGMAGI
jgi:hypothetical protein